MKAEAAASINGATARACHGAVGAGSARGDAGRRAGDYSRLQQRTGQNHDSENHPAQAGAYSEGSRSQGAKAAFASNFVSVDWKFREVVHASEIWSAGRKLAKDRSSRSGRLTNIDLFAIFIERSSWLSMAPTSLRSRTTSGSTTRNTTRRSNRSRQAWQNLLQEDAFELE